MRKRFLIILVALLLFVIGLIWFALNFNNTTTMSLAPVSNSETNRVSAVPKSRNPATAKEISTQEAQLNTIFATASDPSFARYRYEQMKIDPNFDWKQPINFWGKAVDESQRAISGASIHFTWNDISSKGTSEADATSDGNGLFSLLDRRGKRMSVSVSKEGYYTPVDSRLASFEYADPFEGRFTPNQNNPVIFHLRKKSGTEPLLQFGGKVFIRTNSPVQIDLSTGLTNGGENLVQFELLKQQIRASRLQEWEMRITVPEGGILSHTEEFPFLAPEEGYESSIQIDMNTPKPANARSNGYEGGYFFVKTKSGYGRLEVKMVRGQIFFNFNSYFNTSGSRNLEPIEVKPQRNELPPGVREVIPEFK